MRKQKVIHFLSNQFPNYFGTKIYNTILTPQVKKIRPHETDILNTAQKFSRFILGYEIQLYKWGNGSQIILLVHGWEGHAGNFADIIDALPLDQYTVYSYDAPGHGSSSGGEEIMFDFQLVAKEVIEQLKVKKIISHSFGSVATSYSLAQMPNYELEKCVMITTPSSFIANVNIQCAKLGLSHKAIRQFYGQVAKKHNVNVNQLNVSMFVKDIKVQNALILHDVNDRIIPFSESEKVANNWTNAQLVSIKDTGHFRILRTPEVTSQVIDFLKD